MAAEDVGRALETMQDEAIRSRLAGGDFSAVEGLSLTEEERTLVREAADDYPDVTGHMQDFHRNARIGDVVNKSIGEGKEIGEFKFNPGFERAFKYAFRDPSGESWS